ncbi:putative smr domain-containing protein [Eutypa lata UCREL1]|uniref:Putative smr domain-containing protein n=1 Tax=Eutypa lata (strain UCR-EL1) TaxID=1287681 RepID=M7STL3_EUTLA|nr:putative smr domain-containing protein [Eutypa lata UCREL1]
MEDPAAKLVEELRSLLDEVTILSISSDYDLTNPQEFIAAREVLLAISKNVVAEEATGFNPSGLGVDDVVDINAANSGIDVETTNVAESDVKSNSGLTTTTESSQSLSLGSAASSKTSTLETPILFHVSVFDGLSGDEKENQLSQMFKSLKPIDIKLTLKRLKGDASLAIDELLNLQWLEETDIYSKHNASLGATIVEVIDNYIALGLQSSDAEELVDIKETADKYSWVPYEYISGIFDTCHIRQYALDLIDVLGDYFEKPAYLKYDISYKLATARDHAYMSAASAYRKGRSNPLFKQANAYYVERGRELASNHRQAISAEAEYMVDQKSTKSMIDLHGVTVQDGVDIAKDRVSRWWDSLGEDRARKAKEGFTVVTGIGRHSSDGRSPLRINVFKALVADGWKIEVLTGSYLVTGRRRS